MLMGGLAMKMKVLRRLKYLIAACMLTLSIGTTKASTVYVNDVQLTPVTPSFCGVVCDWLSQPFTFQAGNTVDFGTATLYATNIFGGADLCDPAMFCFPAFPSGIKAWYGAPPTNSDIMLWMSDYTVQGSVEYCIHPVPCDGVYPTVTVALQFTLPADQDTISLIFYS
jgi:hypothetical protein